ncbi:hypothetical protein BDV95DRAFT_196757 [Massariosphaeria phaeospora]|uniref:Uncharacterized protein n=1 Tax=Massariosphaeria phaeospora TaxID=100035 RepID=A0A7C8MGU0_9PLEO|nr:hypothetical protein BDV95DRAFT_196757 [Massariosphaeria phaeospora]
MTSLQPWPPPVHPPCYPAASKQAGHISLRFWIWIFASMRLDLMAAGAGERAWKVAGLTSCFFWPPLILSNNTCSWLSQGCVISRFASLATAVSSSPYWFCLLTVPALSTLEPASCEGDRVLLLSAAAHCNQFVSSFPGAMYYHPLWWHRRTPLRGLM